MKEKIEKLLRETPGLKGKDIARLMNADKKEVNSFLHGHKDLFIQDSVNYGWSMADEFRVVFAKDKWIDGDSFEQTLARSGSPLEDKCKFVTFVLPEGCKMLLDAATKLLALSNQSVWKGKQVALDFADSYSTLTYLNRNGFFDHLADEVSVLPKRPKVSSAQTYQGNAETLMEFCKIDLLAPDEKIPEKLQSSFVSHAGEEYSQPVFTVLAELFNNVRDHSNSPLSGIAALQIYKGGQRPHIQTVISDSGDGIVGTLKPILGSKYPSIAKAILKHGESADAFLVKEVFEKGCITQRELGRGLGLKASGDAAAKLKATIQIRQETFEVTLRYSGAAQPEFKHALNLPCVYGTHICVDFPLDRT